MSGILKIGEVVFPINKSEFRYIEDNGEGSSGWEFDIQTAQSESITENDSLYDCEIRFYSQGDPIPIPLQDDLTGVEIFLEEPFDYWKLPFGERLRAEFYRNFLNKPFEAQKRAKNQVYFTLYVFEHTELKHLSLKFIERKIENEDDLYKILITAKIPKGAIGSHEEDLTIETWIKRLPNGTYANMMMKILEADKIGSATSPLKLTKTVSVIDENNSPKAGDVVVVKALSESVTYGNLELPNGRLAKINRNDVLLGVLGKRRALKGFVGDVPESVKTGDKLHLLNMGGVIGVCLGHHSSLSDAIEVEVLGIAVSGDDETVRQRDSENFSDFGDDLSQSRSHTVASSKILNISNGALKPTDTLKSSAPIVVVAGTCMNSGKTVAATELIKQAHHAGLKVAGAKMSGVAALRDTLNMQDSGASWTASFLDCGLPSTVDYGDLSPVAKAILNHLNSFEPDLIVVELGDGIVGGYAVDSVLKDEQIKQAISSFVFCAGDYVGVIGGIAVLKNFGIEIDVIAGSVTDSQMGEDFVEENYGIKAGNARRDGKRLFELINVKESVSKFEYSLSA